MRRWDYFACYSRHLKVFANWFSYPSISAVRESVSTNHQHPTKGETKDAQVASDLNGKEQPKAGIWVPRGAFNLHFHWIVVMHIHKRLAVSSSLCWHIKIVQPVSVPFQCRWLECWGTFSKHLSIWCTYWVVHIQMLFFSWFQTLNLKTEAVAIAAVVWQDLISVEDLQKWMK